MEPLLSEEREVPHEIWETDQVPKKTWHVTKLYGYEMRRKYVGLIK